MTLSPGSSFFSCVNVINETVTIICSDEILRCGDRIELEDGSLEVPLKILQFLRHICSVTVIKNKITKKQGVCRLERKLWD